MNRGGYLSANGDGSGDYVITLLESLIDISFSDHWILLIPIRIRCNRILQIVNLEIQMNFQECTSIVRRGVWMLE
jgi:hypothetical protein